MAKKKVEELPMMVTASRAKDFAKEVGDGIRCQGDFVDALNAKIAAGINEAVVRALANGRKTLRPEDL
jgi:hypothetical protein